MRRTITLKPNENYSFDIGRMSLILIIRDATRNVIFYGDSISEIELSRSDIVAVVKYQQQRVFLRNDNDVDITVEFQLSDVQISIREQRMALEGGVVVEEITTPIQVSEIQAPVKISGVVPVDISEPVRVEGGVSINNLPDVQQVNVNNLPETQAVNITNHKEVQKVEVLNQPNVITHVRAVGDIRLTSTGFHTVVGNEGRKGLLVQASDANKSVIILCGFMRLKAGGVATLPASNNVTITGTEGDTVYVGEVY